MAAAFEAAMLSSQDRSWELVLVIAAVILTSFCGMGAVAAVLLNLLFRAARALDRLAGLRAPHAPLLVALLSSPLLFLLLGDLARGRQAARVLGPIWARTLLVGVVALLCGLLFWAAMRVGRRILRSPRRAAGLGWGISLMGLTALLLLADARLYRRLYLQVHLVLLAGYFCSGLLATLCLSRGVHPGPGPSPLSSRRWHLLCMGALLTLLASGWWAQQTLTTHQQVRFAALEVTTVSRQLLSALPLASITESPLFLETGVPGRDSSAMNRHLVPQANVVLVTVDALRPDHLGAYGYGRPTSPNIDALSTRSVRFSWAYAQAPLTCYSIPSLHTGDYLKSTLPLLPKAPPTLARILGAHGYTTAAFYNASIFFCDDKQATRYGEEKFGFAHAETLLRPAPELTDRVLAYLREHRRKQGGKLMLWVHYFDVHEPYLQRQEFPFGGRPMDRYDSEIAFVDRAIGRLVAALSMLPGPTIFILTSDHGEEFLEHGGNYHGSSLYEEQIRVPLVFGVPGLGPHLSRSPVQLVDVAPTILALLGIKVPESMRGRSLVPELLGQGLADAPAFSEVHTKKMVRYRDWKLIHDWRRSVYELYDLRADPRERKNLISARPREAARLRALLNGWFDTLRLGTGRLDQDRPESIDLGRIGDRRAVPRLARLMNAPQEDTRWRQEAARLLGQLQDPCAADALWLAAFDDDEQVAAEAAIALGEIKDRRARLVLPRMLASSDTRVRLRAAIAAARVDSPEATPALIEALYSHNWEWQNRAAHYLGFVGDRRAIAPLLSMARRSHLRSRVCLALGRLGARFRDPRILPFLMQQVKHDRQLDVRQRALAGIGYLRDRRAAKPLARLLGQAREMTWLPETLSRLGAVGTRLAPGVDLSPAKKGLRSGWRRCGRDPSRSAKRYLGGSWCVTSGPEATLEFPLFRRAADRRLMLRLRPSRGDVKESELARRSGHSGGMILPRKVKLVITVNRRALAPLALESGWQTVEVTAGARLWRRGKNRVNLRLITPAETPPQMTMVVDYLMVTPIKHSNRRAP